MWGLCSLGGFLGVCMCALGVCLLLRNGRGVVWVFPYNFVLLGCWDVIEGGVHAHGEKVKICVKFL